MTRLPHASWQLQGVKLPKETVTVGPKCSAPGCGRWADHAHHIWRRSFLAGDFNWVKFGDDPETLICNLTGLCFRCHELVTKNEAWIEFDRERTEFLWHGGKNDLPFAVALTVQPQVRRLGAAGEASVVSPSEETGSTEMCEKCGRRKPQRKAVDLPPGEKRPKRTWSLAVPKDAREDGYEIIESLLLSAAEKLGRADHKSWKYFSLVEVLAFFEQTFVPEAP